jgi:PHP family Zn ribbon phosphoesterase
MGKPDFIEDCFACIYGPQPVKRVHTCEKCGYKWKTFAMVDKHRWCPECGGSAPGAVIFESILNFRSRIDDLNKEKDNEE